MTKIKELYNIKKITGEYNWKEYWIDVFDNLTFAIFKDMDMTKLQWFDYNEILRFSVWLIDKWSFEDEINVENLTKLPIEITNIITKHIVDIQVNSKKKETESWKELWSV